MIVDLFLVYHFIKRLATPFEKWDAYEQGIIDKEGNILKKSKDLRTTKERDAWGKFDLMILKLKRLLAKVPGGSSTIASYAAALYLIKEHQEIENSADFITEEALEEKFNHYKSIVLENKDINSMFEEIMSAPPVNSVANVAGMGVGPDGEPGVRRKASNKYKRDNESQTKKRRSFRDTLGKI